MLLPSPLDTMSGICSATSGSHFRLFSAQPLDTTHGTCSAIPGPDFWLTPNFAPVLSLFAPCLISWRRILPPFYDHATAQTTLPPLVRNYSENRNMEIFLQKSPHLFKCGNLGIL